MAGIVEEHTLMLDDLDERGVKVLEKLSEIMYTRLMFATEHHVNTRGERMDFFHYPHIRELYETMHKEIVLQGSVQSFKAQPLTANVHTPTGWRQMGDLQVGDLVSTPDGNQAPIIHVQPQGIIQIYKITLSDGRMVEASGDHLWKVKWAASSFDFDNGLVYDVPSDAEVLTTFQIGKRICEKGGRLLIPVADLITSTFKVYWVSKGLEPHIISIDSVGKKPAQCIVIDHPDHLYITNDYIVTHNSEWAVIDHFAAAYSGLSIFYVVPKYEARNTYVQNRVNRVVENVPEYKRIIGAGFFDSVALKSFGKGTVKYVGSNVFADFKEFPADMIVVDEVDECNEENVAYALDRLRASPFQFKRYIGNPKQKGRGINKHFQMSTQKEWNIPCSKCGEFVEADWFTTVVDATIDEDGNVVDYLLRDREWEAGCGRDIRMICPKCGGSLDRASPDGKWVAKKPRSQVDGYHISMLCSLINSLSGMWDRFKHAIDDPSKMQQFYNSDLGLPFDSMGSKVTVYMLNRCVDEGYRFVIKPDCAHVADDQHEGPCSMGIDVGGTFDVRISFVEPRGKRRAVYIGKVRNIDELHDLVGRYNVDRCVIDSMPEITLVQEFQEMAQCEVWLCRYRSEGTDRRRTYDLSGRIINIDRTEALDRSFAQMKRQVNVLPSNYEAILGGQYAAEMCDPIRNIVDTDGGKQKFEWTKGKDHQRHCDTYDMLAAQLMFESVISDIWVG